jgi:hypothetical protein
VDGGGNIPQHFDGQIADVSVWNVARSQADIQATMNQQLTGSEPGLVVSWRLDAASNGTVLDQTGNNNGTLSSPAPTFTSVTGGLVDVEGGTLAGQGTINGSLRNASEVDLSVTGGTLLVRGDYPQTASGLLQVAVAAGSAGPLAVTGNAVLGGSLNVSLLGGFVPTAGQTFDFLTFGSTSGSFAITNIPTADGGPAFQLTPTANGLSLVGATLPPSSSVNALPAFSDPSFTVSWSGQDNPGGTGVAFFDIFVSDNGGPFVAFLTGTTATSATFTGQRGHTYAFYSVATDNEGNREATPSAAEATTTVRSQVSTTTTLTSSAPSGSTYGQAVTFTATVSANLPGFGTPTGSVQFQVDGSSFGAPVTLVGGTASLTTSALGAGQHSVGAVYTSDSSNFAPSSAGPLSQSVSQATLTVTADNKRKVFGQAVPALTASYSGFVNGDSVAVLSGAPA